MSSDYELQRERNILANKALLAQLGLEKPASPVKPLGTVKKRKASVDDTVRRKSARVAKNIENRNRTPFEYGSDDDDEEDEDEYEDDEGDEKPRKRGVRGSLKRRIPFDGKTTDGDTVGLRRRVVNGRSVQHISRSHVRPDPKVYGAIPGIQVGKWWPTRLACSAAGVHPPPVSGIYGSGSTGAFSVALSGGYEDDIDEGFRFTYTGSGGRDLKGTVNKPKNLRTAPQSCDQTLTGGNLALKTSCDTGMPVRVIRGYKAELGPSDGYRYDGLYQVLRAWEDMGLAGYKVWRFAFKRVDGQAPIRFGGGQDDGDDDGDGESEDEAEGSDSAADIKSETKDAKMENDVAFAGETPAMDEPSASGRVIKKVKTEPKAKNEGKAKAQPRAKDGPKVKAEIGSPASPAAEPPVRRSARQRS